MLVPCAAASAATRAGEVLGWGAGAAGELGEATSAEKNASPLEVALPGETGVGRTLAAGLGTGFVSTTGGQLFGFGGNFDDEAGFPQSTKQPPAALTLPGAVGGVSAVSAGADAGYAITDAGQLFSWGNNLAGQLGRGVGTGEPRRTPAPVTLPGAVGGARTVAAGDGFALVTTGGGQLYSFGGNAFGELGRSEHEGTATPTPEPGVVVLPGAAGAVTQIAAGSSFGLALTSTGQLYSFGDDQKGQLGTGPETAGGTEPHGEPALIAFPAGAGPVTQVAAGAEFALALTASGRLYGWGEGFHGELGFEAHAPVDSPREITIPGQAAPVVQIATGLESAYALSADGRLFGWGSSEWGQLAGGDTEAFNFTPSAIAMPEGATLDTISSGCCAQHVLALVADLGISASLPAAQVGAAYSGSVSGTGGTPPYTYSASGLPAGLSINGATGAVSGTPTSVAGPPTFTVRDAFGILATASVPLGFLPRSCECAPPGPTLLERVRASLLAQLGIHGKGARIVRLLKHGYTLKFKALAAGRATIQWFFVPKGAHVSKKGRPKPVLVASGSQSFSKAGTKSLTIRLTAAGRSMLAHAKRAKLTAKGTFKIAGGATTSATKQLSLSR